MASSKRLSPSAIIALKEALCSIYWYKSDLRSFLSNCTGNSQFISSLNWDNYKRQVVTDLIDELSQDHEKHLGILTKLCYEVTSITTFTHLEQLDGGEQKARAEKLKKNSAVREKLSEINNQFMAIATGTNPQTRGFDLERLMYDLFELFDLDPKASFKNTGEQIDGAFSLEGTEYLFEAKWQKELVGVQDLDAFSSKVRRKLDNTLGVFLSMNEFSPDGVTAHSTGRPNIVLMDGADLMAVLEERIDFVTLLLRKKKHASQTGNIYLHVHEITV